MSTTKTRQVQAFQRRNRGSVTLFRGPYTDAELRQLALDLLDPAFRRAALRMINREAGKGAGK